MEQEGTANPVVAAPAAPGARIEVIDAIRGAALFGILAANIRGFFAPAAAYFNPGLLWTEPSDRLMQLAIEALIMGKFITIFATLFGVGFAIQFDRGQPGAVWVRRLAVLAVFGAAHSFLLWWGDILLSYAVCGFVLLLWRGSSRRLVGTALILYFLPLALFLMGYLATLAGQPMPVPPDPTSAELAANIATYRQGTFIEIFRTRAAEWAMLNQMVPFFITRIIALFLAGVWLWRSGRLSDIGAHLDWWRRIRLLGAVIGLSGAAASAWIDWQFHPTPTKPTLAMAAMFAIQSFTIPALSLFYASAVLFAFRNPAWRRTVQPFACVGRMALTNYLLQSVICTTLFYSYGGALYGTLGPVTGWIPVLAVYGAQIPFSAWWLQSHRWGPMEHLWRRLTYGSLSRVARTPEAPAA